MKIRFLKEENISVNGVLIKYTDKVVELNDDRMETAKECAAYGIIEIIDTCEVKEPVVEKVVEEVIEAPIIETVEEEVVEEEAVEEEVVEEEAPAVIAVPVTDSNTVKKLLSSIKRKRTMKSLSIFADDLKNMIDAGELDDNAVEVITKALEEKIDSVV